MKEADMTGLRMLQTLTDAIIVDRQGDVKRLVIIYRKTFWVIDWP